MAYDGRLMRLAQQRFEEAKERRAENFRANRRALYMREPRLEEIDRELAQMTPKIVASAFRRGTDPRPALQALQEENLKLQQERATILRGMGVPEDSLENKPNCPHCGDSGWQGDEVCACLRAYYARVQNEELSQMLDLGTQSFETFRFDCYSSAPDFDQSISPRMNMERIFDTCRDYAYEFSPKSGNLLLCGESGLGKTFLSASIARVVSDGGHSVVYDTASHIFSRFEAQKFHREAGEDDPDGDVSRYLRCDLLIVDDLGTEMTTSLVQSALYQLVNTRLMSGKKTIISTNLSPDAIGSRYGAAVQSRIQGEYRILPFFGDDIRQMHGKKE